MKQQAVGNKIYQINSYVNEQGFEVKEFVDLFTDGNSRENFFHGCIKLNQQTGDPRMPVIPRMIGFEFPQDVKDVRMAFSQFEKQLEIAMERDKAEAERQHAEEEKRRFEESRQILPVNGGKQLVVPFPGRVV